MSAEEMETAKRTPETFEAVCPKCHRKNRVTIVLRDGFGVEEEFFCAGCGLEMGTVEAGEPPVTELADEA